MKNTIFGIICALLLLGTSCGGGDDDTESISVVGVWGIVDGTEFSYLTLLPNNTFLYAENDLTVNSDAENGLEVGTYLHDSSTDKITFNIVYDDNDPNNDSGIGDIGTSVTFNAKVAADSSSLSLLHGELIFDDMELIETYPIIGVWINENGEEFSYLTLLSNNTFIYAENDLAATSNAENGVEVGTFFYDGSKAEITFDIEYDDNDPGNDSGVGDIGTPSIISSVLSNGNNTLTVAGIVLSREL